MDDVLVGDDHSEPQRRDGKHLGERPEDGDVVILLYQRDGGSVVEVVVGLIDYHEGIVLSSLPDHLLDVLGAVHVPDGHVGVDEHDYARIVVDGIQDPLDGHREIIIVRDLHGLHAVEVPEHPVHVERGFHDDEVLPGLSEDVHQVSHPDQAAVREGDVLGVDAHHISVFMDERSFLGIHRERCRGDPGHDIVEEPSRKAVGVLVLVQSYETLSSFRLVLAECVLHVRIYIQHGRTWSSEAVVAPV